MPRPVAEPIGLGLLVLTFISWLWLGSFARDRWTMSRRLDERQRQLRDRAVVISYGVLLVSVYLVVTVIAVVVVFLDYNLTLTPAVVAPIAYGLILLPLLPLGVLAWIEPDPPGEA